MGSMRKGKILKVKLGYNANSSSIAAIVSVFIWTSVACSAMVNMVSAVIYANRKVNKNEIQQ